MTKAEIGWKTFGLYPEMTDEEVLKALDPLVETLMPGEGFYAEASRALVKGHLLTHYRNGHTLVRAIEHLIRLDPALISSMF